MSRLKSTQSGCKRWLRLSDDGEKPVLRIDVVLKSQASYMTFYLSKIKCARFRFQHVFD